MSVVRRLEGVLLDPSRPVGPRWPSALSGAEAVAGLQAERCPPSPGWLWPGYHCPKDKQLRRDYGFGCGFYWAMWGDHDGRCGICTAEPSKGRFLVVDECEVSHLVRGLLCPRCNRLLSAPIAAYVAAWPAELLRLEVPDNPWCRHVAAIAAYVQDPPALRTGRWVVPADRWQRRTRRLARKRRPTSATPSRPSDYAKRLAAARHGKEA